MNKKQLLELNNIAHGGMVTFTEEPEFLEDVNGMPLGIDVSETHTQKLDGITVTAAEVRAAGLTPEDIPNLTVMELK
ncbi:hypothetical protein [Brevibacterium zhoupengii]|uniref:hypothetical protein n=1 Tax=Brevibacterium zhoupengii TaxID=2898795 RepID=UPI001E5B0C06|nr:hypothetical protein [Brevibacterium zhoupengii]